VFDMTGSSRLRVLAVSFVLVAGLVLVGSARAWARMHATEARCTRPAAVAHYPSAAGRDGSWRSHTLTAAGCGAWRQMYERMHRHHRPPAQINP
jgi:hypothetical protein